MKNRILSILKYLFFLAIGTALVWWQVSGMTDEEQHQFITSLKNANYIYVIPIVLMGLLSHFFRALRWKLLIDPIKKISVSNSFYATLLGYFGNTFVPRAGEVLRCTMLGKYEHISFSKLIGTVIVERAFDLSCFVFFIILTVVVQLDVVGVFVSEKAGAIFSSDAGFPVWGKVLVVIGIVGLLYIFINWFLKRYADRKFIIKFKELRGNLKQGLSTIFHLEKKGMFLLYTLLIWVMYLSQIYLGFRTIGATAHLGVGAAMSVLTLSTLAMIISPGGLGAFPVAVQQVLLVYHIDNISFGWLVWGANTAIILIAGSISFILIIWQNKNSYEKSRHNPKQDLHTAGA